jgi:PHP family Zn ribbon phosphoesterase
MSPQAIVRRALVQGLGIVGITDHNSVENAVSVMKAAEGTDVTILPGMEATSSEEVHILALFNSVEKALELQDKVYSHLPGSNVEDVFGMQVIVNEAHDVLGFNSRMLAGSTTLSVEQVVQEIHALNGLAVAAHVDRESFGIMGQLGFIPKGLSLDALELSPNIRPEMVKKRLRGCSVFPFLQSSDAHWLDQIGTAPSSFLMSEATVSDIRKALRKEEGRKVLFPAQG